VQADCHTGSNRFGLVQRRGPNGRVHGQ
jgi:hypothetical protein